MSMDISQEIPFPVDVFGDETASIPVARFQRELMEVEGAPAEFVVPTILGALSSAGGTGIEVESFNEMTSRPNLYIAVEAESGIGKSLIGNLVFKPLREYEKAVRENFQAKDLPSLVAKARILEAKLKKKEKSGDIDEGEFTKLMRDKRDLERQMNVRRFFVEDCTSEALEKIISQQGGGVALVSTDGRNVVKNLLGRHRNGSMEDDIFIKAWSGDSILVDRITREGIAPVSDPCLSMYIAVQPDLFKQLFRPELFASGFVPRLLPVRMSDGFCRRHSSRGINPEVMSRYADHVRGAFDFYHRTQPPFRFAMSPEARFVMDAFFNEAANFAVLDPTLAPLYRRWAEQACRIALCISIAGWGKDAHAQPLHVHCAQKAVELMRWFGQQQRELLQEHATKAKSDLTAALLNLVQQHPGGISVRDASKKLGATSAAVKAIVAADSKLELINVPTPGRPSVVIKMKHATPGL